MSAGIRSENGFATIVALMGLLLVSALGTALILATSVETLISRNFREGAGAIYAADAVAAFGLVELSASPDWTTVLNGTTHSTWTDGAPGGARPLRDGSTINLTEILNMANCGMPTTCSDRDMAATDAERPWGLNNPRWQLFAWGRVADWLPGDGIDAGYYVVLLVADDPAETDGDPLVDGPGPGFGLLTLRAEAFGPGGAHAAVEQTLARVSADELRRRPDLGPVRVVSWRAGR